MRAYSRADEGLGFLLRYENVAWYEKGAVRILDRRIYPIRTEFVTCSSYKEVAQAIADMVTQSAGPYTAASMGMALAAYEGKNRADLPEFLRQAAYTLSHARPTTVARMESITNGCLKAGLAALERGERADEAIFQHAIGLLEHRYTRLSHTAVTLVDQFPKQGTVMTQCFAETIVGTMLREAQERGYEIRLICPETRPYLQGARLTASVAVDQGVDVTVITDNMPGYVMKEKKVSLFTSAADAICMDGHIVNKIGTFQIALCAHYHGIPYFVTGAPDQKHESAESIVIEQRDGDLVMDALGTRTTKEGVKGFYPAFDITPPTLVSGVATDKGMFSPYDLHRYYADGESAGLYGTANA
ncbi:MAG: S-methyl-5-thioribose-1-phosphate isomerase [Clostridia bacterium]|nr:S-methyl-5-thioribose-1-phosphate isomerase [Clostridia bacterium]